MIREAALEQTLPDVAAGATPARRPRPGPFPHAPVLCLLLVAYLLLAGAYSIATPILEVSDESAHVATTWAIAAGHGLPAMNATDPRRVLVPAQEAGQPPLAHLLDAALTFWIPGGDPAGHMTVNPQANVGSPNRTPWNKELFLHGEEEAFPWHGLALAVHLERFLSLAWGAVAVAAVYALTKLAVPSRPEAPAVAAALVAFNPMVLFITASADNDAPAMALATLILLLLARMLRFGPSPRRTFITGCLIGLAALTKLNAVALALPAVIVCGWPRGRSIGRTGAGLFLLVAPAAVLSGWWFIRNAQLYHDPLALNVFVRIAGPRSHPPGFRELMSELPGVWLSFWGVLGNFNILLPRAWYILVDVLASAAGIGLLRVLFRRPPYRVNPVLLLLAGWLALELVLLFRWTELTTASTGRLLFPAIGSGAVLLALGLGEIAGRFRRPVSAGIVGVLAGGATLALPLAILPAYAPPLFVPPAALRPAQALHYSFGTLELVGATIPTRPSTPGSTIQVTLYWQTTGPVPQDDAYSLQLLGPDGGLVSQSDTLPDGGRVRTSHWPVGTGLADLIPLRIPITGPSPSRGRLVVYVYPVGHPYHRVTVLAADGHLAASPLIGELAIAGTNPYTLLAGHRPDVLRRYLANGWDGQTQGKQIFDDWLRRGPDGGPPTTAPAYVRAQGWLGSP